MKQTSKTMCISNVVFHDSNYCSIPTIGRAAQKVELDHQ